MVTAATTRRQRQSPALAHHAKVIAPWYGGLGQAALHQYLDDDFVNRFNDDLAHGRLGWEERTAWRRRDFFGGYRDHVSLRQPVHGAFHVVSVEVVCDRLGDPAFAPRHLAGGAVTVRRRINGVVYGWLVGDGVALGWRPVDPALDPRSLRASPRDGGVLALEESAPLHASQVHDSAGRIHTVVSGYLPLGGGAVRRQLPGRALSIQPGSADLRAGILQELPRPLGAGTGSEALPDGRLLVVDRGRPSAAFLALVRLVVERHHLGLETSAPELATTASIRAALERWFFDTPRPEQNGADVPADSRQFTARSVFAWLTAELTARRAPSDPAAPEEDPEYRPLLGYLATTQQANLALATPPLWAQRHLPDGSGELGLNLHADPLLMASLAEAVVERTMTTITSLAREVPIPRFAYGDDDVYHAATFVRWTGANCQHLAVGPVTMPFRVAPPYSGEAARPTAIQLPGLKDLRRGLPTHGFVAPADLAKKMLGIRGKFPDLESGDGPSFNLCWWFGFSIPAITICAFILLFIILFVLNLIFWWLPWVFLRLPFFCKRD